MSRLLFILSNILRSKYPNSTDGLGENIPWMQIAELRMPGITLAEQPVHQQPCGRSSAKSALELEDALLLTSVERWANVL